MGGRRTVRPSPRLPRDWIAPLQEEAPPDLVTTSRDFQKSRHQRDGFRVLVVGAGVVGHVEGLALHGDGQEVVLSDVDERALARCRAEGFRATSVTDILLVDVDVVLVSVPTPRKPGRANCVSSRTRWPRSALRWAEGRPPSRGVTGW